jgi:hypothetical protein
MAVLLQWLGRDGRVSGSAVKAAAALQWQWQHCNGEGSGRSAKAVAVLQRQWRRCKGSCNGGGSGSAAKAKAAAAAVTKIRPVVARWLIFEWSFCSLIMAWCDGHHSTPNTG